MANRERTRTRGCGGGACVCASPQYTSGGWHAANRARRAHLIHGPHGRQRIARRDKENLPRGAPAQTLSGCTLACSVSRHGGQRAGVWRAPYSFSMRSTSLSRAHDLRLQVQGCCGTGSMLSREQSAVVRARSWRRRSSRKRADARLQAEGCAHAAAQRAGQGRGRGRRLASASDLTK